ncbi:PREDICTED: odorant receptor 46a-like [Eufriesea mexicana]|uniref:odorant receptor 46a-like n=1 Tax=Eufriesea mexicana TaxID=516756 RepID=UPI00083C0F81|nr:PREDICTED: odorant receptor 46a-like [Eufriesea mexicana]
MTNNFLATETNRDNRANYNLQLNRWFLEPIGAWPFFPTTSNLERIVSFILIVICYSLLLATVIPCILYLILEEKDFVVKMKLVGPVGHWFVGSINYTVLLLRGRDIRYCVEHMEADWQMMTRVKDQQLMQKNAKFGRYVVLSCAIFMQSGVLCFCLLTAFSTKVIQVGNDTKYVHQIPCPVYTKLVDVNASPMNEIVLLVECLSGFIVNSSTVGVFGIAAVLCAHACGQLSVVMLWITEFINEPKEQGKIAPFKQLGMIVEHHLRALSFISYIEQMMNRIYFLELSRCTIHICILSYYIITEWAEHDVQNLIIYFMLLFSISFNIFIICYIGEILSERSKMVGDVVYMTNWYYLPGKDILDLVLVIARSRVVVQITAGKIIHMSVYTFSEVIRCAFAYLNLLCQVS